MPRGARSVGFQRRHGLTAPRDAASLGEGQMAGTGLCGNDKHLQPAERHVPWLADGGATSPASVNASVAATTAQASCPLSRAGSAVLLGTGVKPSSPEPIHGMNPPHAGPLSVVRNSWWGGGTVREGKDTPRRGHAIRSHIWCPQPKRGVRERSH
jgi:hypothetical protein